MAWCAIQAGSLVNLWISAYQPHYFVQISSFRVHVVNHTIEVHAGDLMVSFGKRCRNRLGSNQRIVKHYNGRPAVKANFFPIGDGPLAEFVSKSDGTCGTGYFE